jgi:hypothetical protein
MRRKSSTSTIETLCLMHVLRLYFSALVIDNDEVEADGL